MSETARRFSTERSYYTETTGNITRLFFGRPDEEATTQTESSVPEQLSFFGAATEEATTTDEKAQAMTPHFNGALTSPDRQAQTPRQKALSQPDTVDMATEALENYSQLRELLDWYSGHRRVREATLLTFGVCTGLRISDLVALKISDIVSSLNPIAFKAHIDIREQKTGKRTVSHLDEMLITTAMQAAFLTYLPVRKPGSIDEYLFASRQSHGTVPVSIRQMHRSLEEGFTAVVPHLHCATHTMRKTFVSIIHTFSSQSHMQGGGLNPATACQIALRHNSATTTLAYMGVLKSGMISLRRAVSDFVLGKTVLKSLKSEYVWELEDED